MRCVIVCDDQKNRKEGRNQEGYLAIETAQTLQEDGNRVGYLRVEHWLNPNITNADPAVHGEIYVLQDGLEVSKRLGIYERKCHTQLNSESYMTFGSILKEAFKIIETNKSNSKLASTVSLVKMAISAQINKIKETPVLQYILNAWTYVLPNYLVVDMDKRVLENNLFAQAIFESIRGINEFESTVIFKPKDCKIGVEFTSWEIRDVEELRVAETENKNIENKFENKKRKIRKIKVGLIADCKVDADPFCSVVEAVRWAGKSGNISVEIDQISLCDKSQDEIINRIRDVDGIIMPGGFGNAFLETKLEVIRHARTKGIPFVGICLGFQLAIIEFAKNVLKLKEKATSEEFISASESETTSESNSRSTELKAASDAVIRRMKGAVCRNTGRSTFLGSYEVEYRGGGADIYGPEGTQKYRHRYAFNTKYLASFEEHGMRLCGKSSNNRMVMFKLENHPFFYGVQYHPELSSWPKSVDPIFEAFVGFLKNNKHRTKGRRD